jgi:hypothetical protein
MAHRNETINPSLFQLMYFYFGVLMYFRSGVDTAAEIDAALALPG